MTYRSWLRVLPKRARERYGDDMADVFAALVADARRESGVVGVGLLWMKEVRGLLRFAWRDRSEASATSSRPSPNRGSRFGAEVRWAWRSVRARRGQAVLTVALLSLTLAANAIVFAVADALVFHRLRYAAPEQLVEIQSSPQNGSFLTASLLDEWRKQTDIFQSIQGYLTKSVFLTGAGQTDLVPTADITPNLIVMLGVRPRWGRPFTDADTHEADPIPSLIAEELARKRFGDPARAVGQRIETSAQTLLVVGVMPNDFRFPFATTKLWRAMDPRGPLTRNFDGVQTLARMSPVMSFDVLKTAMAQKSPAVGVAAGTKAGYLAYPAEFRFASASISQRRLSMTLLGAALCLLLTACINVINLELTSAIGRARTHAIQLALGAWRGALARMALLEGAWLVGVSMLLGIGLAWLGIGILAALLPSSVAFSTLRPFALDWRTLSFMTAVAAATWLLASLPLVLHASRSRLTGLLKADDRSASTSRAGVAVRRTLTIAEVALAVVLLVGGSLYVRTYLALLAIDKGFDSTNVVKIGAAIPPQALGDRRRLANDMIERVKAMPGVLAAVDELPPPSFNSPSVTSNVEVDGQATAGDKVFLTHQSVNPEYFNVLKIPLRVGRIFEPYEAETNVVVTESFARRYWPGQNAVGHLFRAEDFGRRGVETVIGVVGDLKSDGDVPGRPQAMSPWLLVFSAKPKPVPPKPITPNQARTLAAGGMFGQLGIMVRLDSMARADAVLQAARTVDPRLRITLDSIDDSYAKAFETTLFTARTVGGFASIAFVVSMAGMYGVMAFLVAGRTREIGIRMALGAAREQISRSVLASSGTLVVIGAFIGLAATLALSRWIQSEMYGVTSTDATTYIAVTLVVIATAIVATWQPARQAARIDPAITLRTE